MRELDQAITKQTSKKNCLKFSRRWNFYDKKNENQQKQNNDYL